MGRGRQKAKHTKVARELKYNIPETDYEQLQRELQSSRNSASAADNSSGLVDDELSKWSEYLDDYDDSDEDQSGRA